MPSMHPLLRVVEQIEVFMLELLPALQLLVTPCVTVGTSGYLLLSISFLPLLEIFLMMVMFPKCVSAYGWVLGPITF